MIHKVAVLLAQNVMVRWEIIILMQYTFSYTSFCHIKFVWCNFGILRETTIYGGTTTVSILSREKCNFGHFIKVAIASL